MDNKYAYDELNELAEKIINDPIVAMKNVAERSSRDVYLDVTRKLFNLDQEKNNEKQN